MKILKYIAWVVGILGAICLLLYLTMFDVWTIPTDDPRLAVSLEPTLSAGDVLVISRHGTPERGHLMRCPDSRAPGRYAIGRYIAKGGETVTIADEVVSVDNSRIPSKRGCTTVTLKNPETQEEVKHLCSVEEISQNSFEALRAEMRREAQTNKKVENGKIYVVSDNRHMHDDSRDFDQIDPTPCQHIVFRLWGTGGIGDSKKRFSVIW
jgi:signal peptidase I